MKKLLLVTMSLLLVMILAVPAAATEGATSNGIVSPSPEGAKYLCLVIYKT